MNKPLVNWEEIEKLTRPPMSPKGGKGPLGGPGRGIGGWDNQASFYNMMAAMESEGTLNQINCFDTDPQDTFLDVGCGPGRITAPMSKRAKSVTAIDASPKMLEFCKKNAEVAGSKNVKTVLLDWEDDESVSQIEKHDIVLASRSVGMRDLKKLCDLANKYVVIVIWSHGCPSIPEITGKLFEGAEKESDRHFRPKFPPRDRRLGNNLLYNKVYDMGYNPNLKIVNDGFKKEFKNKEDAYSNLRKLGKNLDENKDNIFRQNVDKFLTENSNGTVTFESKTKTLVMWWKPEIEV